MQINQRKAGDVVILDLDGRFVRGVGDIAFRTAFNEVLDSGASQLLLDLSNVPFIDSSAIGELVAAKRTADDRGLAIKLVRLEDRVAKTLRLGMILPLFETYTDEKQALTAFASAANTTAD